MHRQGMNEFHQWIKEKIVDNSNGDGISCPKVEIALIDESMGYGLFAKEDIRQNETIIKIPEHFLITANFVANIPEYIDVLKRFRIEPADILALFFTFERIYFDYYYGPSPKQPSHGTKWKIEKSKGFEIFLKRRKERIIHEAEATTDIFWWKHYVAVLPRQFGTPLFKYYLEEDGEEKIKGIAAQMPQQIKDKLLGQLAELKSFEEKLFNILNAHEKNDGKDYNILPEYLADITLDERIEPKMDLDSKQMCRGIACWAWHIVNTRSIFVDNLPYHPLVDALKDPAEKEKSSTKASLNRRFSNRKQKEEESDYGGCIALVPLVDMMNHKYDAQCIPMFDRKSHSYIVRAEHRTLMAGQQLFVCYGAHDNAQLWIEYGFRVDENPFNRVNIPIELFIAIAERCGIRVSSTKQAILAKANLPCTIYATDELPSYALRKNCSILLMSKEKLANWSQHIFGPLDAEKDELDDDEELRLLIAILARLKSALTMRREACQDEEICPFWADQILILERMLTNLQ